MSASPDPPVSVKLRRLLNAYAVASENKGYCQNESTYDVAARAVREQAAARTALLDYLARHYVRRDVNRPPASPRGSYKAARGILPWKPGDELPEARIRRMRDADRQHTLHLDDDGDVAGGVGDFEGDDGD